MKFRPTRIPDVIRIEPNVLVDERGFFMETWNQGKFDQARINCKFVQDNHSRSINNTLRGLHYQVKQTQGKLVRAVVGTVYDVAVDVRRDSPTFGQWVSEYLSAENKALLWVPPGFAHGFYVTSDFAEVEYKCTEFYAQPYERCIYWDDPDLDIDWPINGKKPLVSPKDDGGLSLRRAELLK